MTRLPALLLCLLLCLSWLVLPCRAVAPPGTGGIMETTVPGTESVMETTEPEASGEGAQSIVLTQLTEYDTNSHWPYLNRLILLEPEEALADVLSGADYQYADYTDTEGKSHRLPIQWDLSEESLTQPGLHILRAAPVLEAGMVLGEGFDGIVSWPMYRRGGGDPVEVIPLHGPTTTDALITQGSRDPLSELAIVTKNKRCALWKNGWWNTTDEILWTWDVSKLDTNRAGKQTLPGNITGTPEWMTIPEEHRSGEVTVFVLPPDRIELYAPTNLSRNGILKFEWLYSTETVSSVLLQARDERGQWSDCDTGWYRYRTASRFTNGYFQLHLLEIPAGEYTFRLSYQDSASGEIQQRYTEPMTITIPADLAVRIPADGAVPDDLDIGGDRDGGDSEGDDLPDYSQPAPTYPEPDPGLTRPTEEATEPTAAPRPTAVPTAPEPTEPPVMEWVTDSFTDISGVRLAVLTELGDTVLFEKEGISVEIPSDLLKALALEDFDLLEVVILRPEYDRIQLSVLKNGVPVTVLTGTTICLPWEGAVPVECREEKGSAVPVTVEGALLRLSVDGPGTYLLSAPEPVIPTESEAPVPAETEIIFDDTGHGEEIPDLVLVLFPALLVLLILAIIALWRRLRHE